MQKGTDWEPATTEHQKSEWDSERFFRMLAKLSQQKSIASILVDLASLESEQQLVLYKPLAATLREKKSV